MKNRFTTNFLKLSILAVVLFTVSCSKDNDTPAVVVLETKTVSNLAAPQTAGAAFIKFSFSENAIVTHDNWDIAFRGTTIIVNGGVKKNEDEPSRTGSGAISIVKGTLASVTAFPTANTFAPDAATAYAIPTGSNNGWYSYDDVSHIISPIAGKVFVVKTYNGKYAKFEILSYYKDAPAVPNDKSESRNYTFKFVYQVNSDSTF